MKTSIPKLHSYKLKSGVNQSNVDVLNQYRKAKKPIADILWGAFEADLEDIVIIGMDKNGERYIASSSGNASHDYRLAIQGAETLLWTE